MRNFLGPAGLLSDNLEEEFDTVDLNSLDENDSDQKENKMFNLCSQNTKNLFTSGAWQLMKDDLPYGAELLDIEYVKRYAMTYEKKGPKISLLVENGVLDEDSLVCWKRLLNCLPPLRWSWSETLARKREL